MQKPLSATPDEVLAVVQEMFPSQLDRAVAELTIRKQDELIIHLQEQLLETTNELAHTGHAHDED